MCPLTAVIALHTCVIVAAIQNAPVAAVLMSCVCAVRVPSGSDLSRPSWPYGNVGGIIQMQRMAERTATNNKWLWLITHMACAVPEIEEL